MSEPSTGVWIWWGFLMVVTLFNFGAWSKSRQLLEKAKAAIGGRMYRARRVQLLLSAVFVVGCGFRSFFPRADVQRIVLVDSWLSSVFVGRSVATVAELAFAAQWALLLNVIGKQYGSRYCHAVSRVVFPLIFFAEVASWYAVLTTNFLGNVIEQSSWTFGAFLTITGLFATWPQADRALRRFVLGTAGIGGFYIVFMINVDIHMYFTRWEAAQAAGASYLSLEAGVVDAATRWVVTHAWTPWQDELAWMALYFSVAVWISLALAHAPGLRGVASAKRHASAVQSSPAE